AAARVRSLKEKKLNVEIERPLALSPRDESPLGNLVADWMRASVPTADAAITNSGGLRASLPAGRLTSARFYELLPFDNRETIIELSGAELRRIIEHNLQQRDSVVLVSGVRATAICENRRLRVAIRRDSGTQIRDHDELRVVTTDFLASGGGRVFAPRHPLRVVRRDGPPLPEDLAAWPTRAARPRADPTRAATHPR